MPFRCVLFRLKCVTLLQTPDGLWAYSARARRFRPSMATMVAAQEVEEPTGITKFGRNQLHRKPGDLLFSWLGERNGGGKPLPEERHSGIWLFLPGARNADQPTTTGVRRRAAELVN